MIDSTIIQQPYYITQDKRVSLYHGDTGILLPALHLEGEVQAIITDPPYGISWQSNWVPDHAKKAVLAGDKDLSWMADFLMLCEKLLRPDGHMFIFTRWDKLGFLQALIRNLTELKIRNCIVWDRITHGAGDLGSFAPVYDLILYVTKGKPKLAGDYRPKNLWSVNRVIDKYHPTPKPIDLFEKMIMYTTQMGDLVLDPFAGSGPCLIAANKMNRRAIGIEINQVFCDVIISRLQQVPLFFLQDELPMPMQEGESSHDEEAYNYLQSIDY